MKLKCNILKKDATRAAYIIHFPLFYIPFMRESPFLGMWGVLTQPRNVGMFPGAGRGVRGRHSCSRHFGLEITTYEIIKKIFLSICIFVSAFC